MEIKIPGLKAPLGSGDLVKDTLQKIGVKPCGGCRQRQETMNRVLQFVPSAEWEPGRVPEGWRIEAECNKAALFKKGEGTWMVWGIVEGQYVNSHHFCCSGLDEMAREEYRRRCL